MPALNTVVAVRSYSPRYGATSLERLRNTFGCLLATMSATARSWLSLATDQMRHTARASTPCDSSSATAFSTWAGSSRTSTEPL